jgi:predicted DNA-binding ribbon-helix-helix protein
LSGGGSATLIKRSFSLVGHRTSVALEQEFWMALTHIAVSRRQTLTALVAEADARRPVGRPLASALRVLALQTFFHSRQRRRHQRPLASDGTLKHTIDQQVAQSDRMLGVKRRRRLSI